MNKTIEYFKEVIAEAKHVNWPTKKQAIFYTLAVLVVSVLVAYYLGILDFGFSKGLQWLLIR